MENQTLISNIEGMLESRLFYTKALLKENKKKKLKKYYKGQVSALKRVIEHLQHFKKKI